MTPRLHACLNSMFKRRRMFCCTCFTGIFRSVRTRGKSHGKNLRVNQHGSRSHGRIHRITLYQLQSVKYGYLSLRQVGYVHIIAKRVCSENKNCFKVKNIVHSKASSFRSWFSIKLFALNDNMN